MQKPAAGARAGAGAAGPSDLSVQTFSAQISPPSLAPLPPHTPASAPTFYESDLTLVMVFLLDNIEFLNNFDVNNSIFSF